MHSDHRLHLDDAGGDLDEAQAQRIELGDAPHRTFRHRHAQAPHQPVRAGVQEQPKLIGAYQHAADVVERLDRPLGEVLAVGGREALMALPAVGRSIGAALEGSPRPLLKVAALSRPDAA